MKHKNTLNDTIKDLYERNQNERYTGGGKYKIISLIVLTPNRLTLLLIQN